MKLQKSVISLSGGLIKVEGSAKYLKESKESEDVANVIMKAKYRTRDETIPTHTPLNNINLCKMKGFTHVVTGITYGMDASFDFQRIVKNDESFENIEGELKINIQNIPSVKVEAEAKVYFRDRSKFSPLVFRIKIKTGFNYQDLLVRSDNTILPTFENLK